MTAPQQGRWVFVPAKTTQAMRDALRTGSLKDYPSDELCEVRYAAMLAAAPNAEHMGVSDEQINEAVRAYIQAGKRNCNLQEAMRCAIEASQQTPSHQCGCLALVKALSEVRNALEVANFQETNSPICDTIWMPSGTETLFDYLDSVIAAHKDAKP